MEEGDGGIAEGSVGGRRGMEAALFLDRLHHRSLPPFLPPPLVFSLLPLVTHPASAHERSWEKWTHTHTHTLSNASHARLSLGSGSEGTKSHTHTHTITWCRWDIRCSLSSEESANEPALKIFTRNVSVSRPSERTGTLSSGKTAAHLKFVYSLCVLLFIFFFFLFYWSAQQVFQLTRQNRFICLKRLFPGRFTWFFSCAQQKHSLKPTHLRTIGWMKLFHSLPLK